MEDLTSDDDLDQVSKEQIVSVVPVIPCPNAVLLGKRKIWVWELLSAIMEGVYPVGLRFCRRKVTKGRGVKCPNFRCIRHDRLRVS